jgi:hypothetical protein
MHGDYDNNLVPGRRRGLVAFFLFYADASDSRALLHSRVTRFTQCLGRQRESDEADGEYVEDSPPLGRLRVCECREAISAYLLFAGGRRNSLMATAQFDVLGNKPAMPADRRKPELCSSGSSARSATVIFLTPAKLDDVAS